MSTERARRLAATPAPSPYAGKGLREISNLARHKASSRRYIRRDPGAKRLRHEADVWSGYKGPGMARSGRLQVLQAHVAAAEVAPVPLYRGVALPARLKRGDRLTLPISSFTSDPKVARRFAAHRQKQVGGQQQLMEVHGARALHIAPLVRRRGIGMSEWVGQGEFRVTRGGQMARLVPVKKSMPSVLSVPKALGTLRRPTYRDSSLATRRTPSGTLVATRRRAGVSR